MTWYCQEIPPFKMKPISSDCATCNCFICQLIITQLIAAIHHFTSYKLPRHGCSVCAYQARPLVNIRCQTVNFCEKCNKYDSFTLSHLLTELVSIFISSTVAASCPYLLQHLPLFYYILLCSQNFITILQILNSDFHFSKSS